jgi:hypothetical protein
MIRSLLFPDDASRSSTSSAGCHSAIEDQAVLDFLRGDYLPVAASASTEPVQWARPYVQAPPLIHPPGLPGPVRVGSSGTT